MNIVAKPANASNSRKKTFRLKNSALVSVIYHDIFDYPLRVNDLGKWRAGKKAVSDTNLKGKKINRKEGYFFLKGRENIVAKRKIREKISIEKRKIAKRASKIIGWFPFIKMIGITGALAMNNSTEGSDIDLILITKNNTLWTSRGVIWILLKILRVPLRKPKDKKEKDKLCLNIWMDEGDLVWERKRRNIFTAHEIAQVVPLVNKNNTYEDFIYKNKWIFNYWPNAIRNVKSPTNIKNIKSKNYLVNNLNLFLNPIIYVIEPMAYRLQHKYMRRKITKETIGLTRALFHPNDWSEVVLSRMRH